MPARSSVAQAGTASVTASPPTGPRRHGWCHAPRKISQSATLAGLIGWQGLLLAGVTLTAFFVGMRWYGTEGDGLRHATTMGFMTLALAQIFHAFNARSRRQSAFAQPFTNAWLWAAVLACLVLQLAAVYWLVRRAASSRRRSRASSHSSRAF